MFCSVTFSDGAKQTGVFLACLSLLQQIIMDADVDIPTTVKLIKNDQSKFISSMVSKITPSFIVHYLSSSSEIHLITTRNKHS